MRFRARRVRSMIGRIAGGLASALALAFGISTLASGSLAIAATPASAAHTSAHTATAPHTAAEPGVTLSLAADDGGRLTSGQPLTATATITNGGSVALAAGTLSLWLDDARISTRADLDGWLAAKGADADARVLGTTITSRLEPGTTATVQISVPAASVALKDQTTSVFGIGATLSNGGSAQAVDRGSLVWSPGGANKATNLAIAVPLTTPATATGLISSDDLATYTAPNGLLSRQLDGLVGHPNVAIGLDPMILASIRVLGSSAPVSAIDWRNQLLGMPNDIFPLRYGDADAAGEVQSGITKLLGPTTLNWALDAANFATPDEVGETPESTPTDTATPGADTSTPTPTSTGGPQLPTLEKLLSWPYTMSGIVWPADNTVRAADLPVFAANGLTTTILSSTNTATGDLSTTPNAALKVGASSAVVADATVSAALRQAVTASSDATWNQAMAELNSQLALIGQENGPDTRTILATLDRGWPSDAVTLPRTLSALDAAPWVASVTLPQAIAATPTPGVSVKNSPEPAARIATIGKLTDAEKRITAFSSILDDPSTMTGPTRVQLLSLLSVSWQNSKNDWGAATSASLKTTANTLQAIKIVPASSVNVASTEAPIPITVENSLKQRVNIVLSASPSNGRLEIDGDTKKTLQADSRATLIVPVKATLGNGKVRLSLSLTSPTGVSIGSPAVLPVEVHADWEGLGALVVAILVILLFGFGIVRNILRHRGERDGDSGDAPPTDPSLVSSGTEPESPSGPSASSGTEHPEEPRG